MLASEAPGLLFVLLVPVVGLACCVAVGAILFTIFKRVRPPR